MEKLLFEKCFLDVTGGNLRIKQVDYLPEGEIPIIDQGKLLIGGYTNDTESIVKCKLPCIIYGDHSRNIKYFEKPFAIGADGVKLLEATNRIIPKYGYYFLQTVKLPDAGYDRSFKYLKRITIPVPDLETQNKIVAILDKAKAIVDKREQTIRKYDELLRAVFLEMFAPYQGFNLTNLVNVADITSGLTKGKKYSGKETRFAPYMRVANVQDGFLDLSDIKKIEATDEEIERYNLNENDLLLTEGGDPDKLGRGTLWKNEIANCIFQNHIFRVRITDKKVIIPTFLSFQISSNYGKNYFLKAAKQTSGIASINSTQLKAFPVYIPPIERQNKFNEIVLKIEKVKKHLKRSLNISGNLQIALSQLAFNGQLNFNTAVDLEVLLENDYEFFKENSTTNSIQLLLERLDTAEQNNNKFNDQQTYDKAKSFVFELLKEGKVEQIFDVETQKIKLSAE